MHKIFLLILMCKRVITEDEESNAKYIDLLPEEEKQEFLNRIARRILEGIKSNDTPNESHAEITDDQLDAQDAFVREILKAESDNFKNDKKRHDTKEIDENDRVESINDNVNESNDDRAKSMINDKEEHIDLTLREEKRQKRKNSDSEFDKETTTEISYDVIPVKTVYDQFENDDVKIDTKPVLTLEADQKGNADKEMSVSESGTKSDLILPSNNLFTEFLNESDKNENLRKSFHNKVKLGNTEIIDFEQDSNENYTNQEYNINEKNTTLLPTTVSQEVSDSTTNGEGTWDVTQHIYKSDSKEKEEKQIKETSTVFYNTINNEESQKESMKMSSNSNGVAETNKDEESTITAIINDTKLDSHESNLVPLGKYLRSITQSDEYEDVERRVIDTVTAKNVETYLDDILISTTETASHNKSLSQVKIDSQIEAKDKENIGVTKRASAKILNITTSENLADLASVGSYIVKNNPQKKLNNENKTILRARDNSDVSQIDENESLPNADEDSNKVKVYEVYEADANQPHFKSTGRTEQKDHPLYVPVYNYAPENAYFRPYNKLGPNIEDTQYQDNPESKTVVDSNQSNLLNTRNRFSGYNNNKKRENFHNNVRNTKQSFKKQNEKRYEFIKPVTQNLLNQDIYYNPYDYADLDYYFGRILRRGKKIYNKIYKSRNTKTTSYEKYFPDSNEKGHPVNSIHKSDKVKDHVRAIRQILYLQKLFGYVPQASDNIGRKANQYFQIGKTSNKPKHDNIEIDYYFGRADSNENDKTNQEFIWHKPKFNIVPLTPNPLSFETKPEKPHLQMDSSESKLSSAFESISQEIRELPFKKLFESMLDVLKDTLKDENDKLLRYDWLKTTVNIQAALRKLMDLIEQLKYGEHVHPKDIELIKYTIYIFESSKKALDKELKNTDSKKIESKNAPRGLKRVMKFPKIIKKRKMKEPIKRWKEYAALLLRDDGAMDFDSSKEQKFVLLNDFEELLQDLLLNLNDLHDAIQHISVITEYKNQNWLQDLKIIYLAKGSEKSLAQVILHLSLSRLLDLIEESASHGVEEDFRSYVKKNREFVKKSQEECVFVLNVLEEMRRINASKP